MTTVVGERGGDGGSTGHTHTATGAPGRCCLLLGPTLMAPQLDGSAQGHIDGILGRLDITEIILKMINKSPR